MSTIDVITWSDTRREWVDRFGGQTPRTADESTIIDNFERSPLTVLRVLEDVENSQSVRFPWAVAASRLIAAGTPLRDAVRNIGASLESQLKLTEAFLRNAGGRIETEHELLDEVFGDRGRLRPWADDAGVRKQIVGYWRRQRSAAEQLEAEESARAAAWVEKRYALRTRTPPQRLEIDESMVSVGHSIPTAIGGGQP